MARAAMEQPVRVAGSGVDVSVAAAADERVSSRTLIPFETLTLIPRADGGLRATVQLPAAPATGVAA
jgi:hypothetical protein